jgi:hypothetical protein
MVTLSAERIEFHAEHLHDDLVELWWGILPSIGTMPERRQLFDAFLVCAKQRIGAAVKEALEKQDREDEDAIRRMEWEGCPHGQ